MTQRPSLRSRLTFLPTLIWDVVVCQLIRRQNWWDEVDEGLYLGAFPTRRTVQRLYDLGIRSVINTCSEMTGPLPEYERLGIKQLRIPTDDFTEPTVENIRRAVKFIDAQRQGKRAVYVHCKSGRGRSSTIVLCYLMQHKNLPPEPALHRLRKRRPQVLAHLDKRACVQQFWLEFSKASGKTEPA